MVWEKNILNKSIIVQSNLIRMFDHLYLVLLSLGSMATTLSQKKAREVVVLWHQKAKELFYVQMTKKKKNIYIYAF